MWGQNQDPQNYMQYYQQFQASSDSGTNSTIPINGDVLGQYPMNTSTYGAYNVQSYEQLSNKPSKERDHSKYGNQSRNTGPKEDGKNWKCLECGNINWPWRKECNKCKAPNPNAIKETSILRSFFSLLYIEDENRRPNYSHNEGDWECPNCHNINWYYRKQCNVCKAWKSSLEDQKQRKKEEKYPVSNEIVYRKEKEENDGYDDFGRPLTKRKESKSSSRSPSRHRERRNSRHRERHRHSLSRSRSKERNRYSLSRSRSKERNRYRKRSKSHSRDRYHHHY